MSETGAAGSIPAGRGGLSEKEMCHERMVGAEGKSDVTIRYVEVKAGMTFLVRLPGLSRRNIFSQRRVRGPLREWESDFLCFLLREQQYEEDQEPVVSSSCPTRKKDQVHNAKTFLLCRSRVSCPPLEGTLLPMFFSRFGLRSMLEGA